MTLKIGVTEGAAVTSIKAENEVMVGTGELASNMKSLTDTGGNLICWGQEHYLSHRNGVSPGLMVRSLVCLRAQRKKIHPVYPIGHQES